MLCSLDLVATSLCDGEAKEKQVAILSIHKKDFHVEPGILKSVRPFIMREISLAQELKTQKLDDRVAVTKYLSKIVDEAVKDANEQWQARHESSTELTPPLPLIRIRVDYSGPNAGGGNYTVENPQRFSNRFVGRVANSNDVVQFYLKKKQTRRKEVTLNDQMRTSYKERLTRVFVAHSYYSSAVVDLQINQTLRVNTELRTYSHERVEIQQRHQLYERES